MTKYFCVAGHTFSLTIQEASPLWGLLCNYEPFEVAEPAGPMLFDLHVNEVPQAADLDTWTHVLTDQSDADMPRIEFYERGHEHLLRIATQRDADICSEIVITDNFHTATVTILQPFGRFPIDNAFMLMYAFCTATCGTLQMHASVILHEGKGYLFLGKSGTGKSTHSRQWLSVFPTAQLLNDDNPILRVADQATVFGSPWSGKTPCYKNDSAPIAGIVLLRQAPHNQMRRLALPEAYAAIYSSSSGLRCNPGMANGLHATVAQLASQVPCFQLDCLPNEEAAILCKNTIG